MTDQAECRSVILTDQARDVILSTATQSYQESYTIYGD